jgi:hypothetical protein
VRVLVDGPEGHWSASSRCLLVEEVTRLAEWLESAATNGTTQRFDTLDNEINFELVAHGRLRVYLEGDFRPPQFQQEPMGEFFLDYHVTKRTLQQAASYFRERLKNAAKESESTKSK